MSLRDPVITFVIPCFHSADYMDRCISSIVAVVENPGSEEKNSTSRSSDSGGKRDYSPFDSDRKGDCCPSDSDRKGDCCPSDSDVEILIVDDGSSDQGATLSKALRWEADYPGLIRAIHEENGGPGEAINTGLKEARGNYFKVVDSDDWLDPDSLRKVLAVLRKICGAKADVGEQRGEPDGDSEDKDSRDNEKEPECLQGRESGKDQENLTRQWKGAEPESLPGSGREETHKSGEGQSRGGRIDMLICNYVYEYEDGSPSKPVRYVREFPENRPFTWDEMLHPFPIWRYMMMHSAIYRTELLRSYGLHLPPHTFYVDEIVIYTACAHAETLMYLDVDLYRYLIGRADQSVNEEIMASRCDQQCRVGHIKIDAVDIGTVQSRNLQRYLTADLTITMCFCTVFTTLSGRPDHYAMRDEIWDYLKKKDRRLWHKIRWSFIGWWCNLRSPLGIRAFKWGYRTVRNIFKFN